MAGQQNTKHLLSMAQDLAAAMSGVQCPQWNCSLGPGALRAHCHCPWHRGGQEQGARGPISLPPAGRLHLHLGDNRAITEQGARCFFQIL